MGEREDKYAGVNAALTIGAVLALIAAGWHFAGFWGALTALAIIVFVMVENR